MLEPGHANDLICEAWGRADLRIVSRSRPALPCLAGSGRCLIAASACGMPCFESFGSHKEAAQQPGPAAAVSDLLAPPCRGRVLMLLYGFRGVMGHAVVPMPSLFHTASLLVCLDCWPMTLSVTAANPL